jgi:hypothetical protein
MRLGMLGMNGKPGWLLRVWLRLRLRLLRMRPPRWNLSRRCKLKTKHGLKASRHQKHLPRAWLPLTSLRGWFRLRLERLRCFRFSLRLERLRRLRLGIGRLRFGQLRLRLRLRLLASRGERLS